MIKKVKINSIILDKINDCINRIQNQDRDAVIDLYELFNPKLLYISYSILHKKEYVEEFVQDFWAKINYFCDKWIIKTSGYKFLVKVAKNFAIDRYRKLKKENDRVTNFDTLEYMHECRTKINPLECLENLDILEKALKSLTELERLVWFEYFYGEKSLRAIAKKLEMSKSSVGRIFQDIKEKIKKNFK